MLCGNLLTLIHLIFVEKIMVNGWDLCFIAIIIIIIIIE